MSKRKIHKLEREDVGLRHETCWIACRDPERFQEPDGKHYIARDDWALVTCKRCLAEHKGGEEGT